MPILSATRGEFEITTDQARLDAVAIHDYLSNHAYWVLGRPLDTVQRALANSLCFGVYLGERQVGLARVRSCIASSVSPRSQTRVDT
jgi:hypothetical protein